MKKPIFIRSILLFTTILSACGSKTTQTPLVTATPTLAPAQPTPTPTSTDTPMPTPTPSPTAEISTELPIAGISFAEDVMPIFNRSCNKCHGVEQIKEGLDMRTYDTLMAGSFNGTVITAGNATDSFLVKQLVDGEMPKRGPKLTTEEIQIIIDWINAGALNN